MAIEGVLARQECAEKRCATFWDPVPADLVALNCEILNFHIFGILGKSSGVFGYLMGVLGHLMGVLGYLLDVPIKYPRTPIKYPKTPEAKYWGVWGGGSPLT